LNLHGKSTKRFNSRRTVCNKLSTVDVSLFRTSCNQSLTLYSQPVSVLDSGELQLIRLWQNEVQVIKSRSSGLSDRFEFIPSLELNGRSKSIFGSISTRDSSKKSKKGKKREIRVIGGSSSISGISKWPQGKQWVLFPRDPQQDQDPHTNLPFQSTRPDDVRDES